MNDTMLKYREYQRNYRRKRRLEDPEFVESERQQCKSYKLKHPEIIKRLNIKHNKINSPKRIVWTPEHKRLHVKENPRKGICSICGAVKGVDCKKTVLHHTQYDDIDPLNNTIELCVSCHMKEHNNLGRL